MKLFSLGVRIIRVGLAFALGHHRKPAVVQRSASAPPAVQQPSPGNPLQPITMFDAQMAAADLLRQDEAEIHRIRVVKFNPDCPTVTQSERRDDNRNVFHDVTKAYSASGSLVPVEELKHQCLACGGYDTEIFYCDTCTRPCCKICIKVLEYPDEVLVLCPAHLKHAEKHRRTWQHPSPGRVWSITKLDDIRKRHQQDNRKQKGEGDENV